MSELFRQARRAVQLSGPRLPSSEAADRWLIGLRWGAIGGMLATTLIARQLVPDLPFAPLLIVFGAITLLNVGWFLVVRRFPPGVRSFVSAQIAVDVVALTTVLWFSGGVQNPFAAFLVFQIVLAGLLGTGRTSVLITMLAIAAVAVLYLASPMPLDAAPYGRHRTLWIGECVSLASLSAFLGFFVLVYVQRLDQLRAESARNEKLAMLGRLVGGMSHELNTPLATILLASKDLALVGQQMTATPESTDVVQLSRTIVDEAQRGADIIGLMRGHVRPDQFRETVELSSFVTDFATRELNRLRFDGARVIDAPRPVQLSVLKAGISQVLTNVLTNAVEATSRTTDPLIEVSVTPRGAGVEIAVRDNGPGISSDLLARLGEPFQTTKADAGGMGLGLYVSTVLAEKMDGTLHIESDAPRGTRVTLRLTGKRKDA